MAYHHLHGQLDVQNHAPGRTYQGGNGYVDRIAAYIVRGADRLDEWPEPGRDARSGVGATLLERPGFHFRGRREAVQALERQP